MLEHKTLIPKTERALIRELERASQDPQRRLMVVALMLLLVALGFVLYRDRDFWFPEGQQAELEEPSVTPPATPADTVTAQPAPAIAKTARASARSKHSAVSNKKNVVKAKGKTFAAAVTDTPATATATTHRTVLPPLEVEVVAGDKRRTIRPGSNSVRVDLQPGAPTQPVSDQPQGGAAETAASLTSNAAERVQMSADTSEVVSHPVKPGYPLLARQMKVQGSVILQALISKEGAIQDLHVVSGPRILATAAQTAVRQWRFKPHFQGSEPVETQAKITVNFTISTN